ncbi:hypothetical protein C5167_031053 [Papaver somniferum]|nr:hypothetical protein C5167_031053 [Papaver somniferum]
MAILSCSGGISKTKKYTLLKKFEENDCERITWLMELFTRYSKKVGAVANHLKSEQLISSELYKEKLQNGFSKLQVRIDVVIVMNIANKLDKVILLRLMLFDE